MGCRCKERDEALRRAAAAGVLTATKLRTSSASSAARCARTFGPARLRGAAVAHLATLRKPAL
jgi:hypothetical protein